MLTSARTENNKDGSECGQARNGWEDAMERCETPPFGQASVEAHAPQEYMRIEVRIPPFPSAPGYARSLVREWLPRWSLDHLCDDAAIVANELVTNAIVHVPSGAYRFVLARLPDGVLIEVHDRLPVHPTRIQATPDEEHGRGMWLVDELSTKSGADNTDLGKRVWAILEA